MSDEGEDLAQIQNLLDARFESRRLVQSSNAFRDKIEAIEKLSGYERKKQKTAQYDTFLGCRITKAMKEMKITDNELELLYDFIKATAEVSEAQNDWIEAFSYKLTPRKTKPKSVKSVKATEKVLANKKLALEETSFRLTLLDYILKKNTNRGGSSLTWFLLLAPQLEIRKPGYLELFSECLHSGNEKLAEIIADKGMDYCANEYIVKYFDEKERVE